MGEKLILKCLFDIEKLDGKDIYLFKNKDITREPLYLNREVYLNRHNQEEFQYSFRTLSSIRKNSDEVSMNERTYNLDIYIDEDSREVTGEMIMLDDYKLSDSACMTFYDLDIEVGYVSDDDNFPKIKHIYYDKTAIMRRNIIKNIIT